MKLKDHYKVFRKKRKSYILILFFIVLLFPRYYSVSRFASVSDIDSSTGIANWVISINGQNLTSSTTNIESQIKIIHDNDGETELGPGDTGYFDIEINPAGTEVSIEYTINMNLGHLPTGTTITGCDLITNSNTQNFFTGNTHVIEDSINLNNNQPLSNSDTHKYRVHCKIDDDAVLTAEDDYYVSIAIDIQQKI